MLIRSNSGIRARTAALMAIIVATCSIGTSQAAVKSVGSISPVPPSAGGTFTTQLIVGDEQAAGSDIRAWMQIDQGTALQYGTLIVGDEEDYFGEVNVVGDFLGGINTQFVLSGFGSSSTPTAQIGRDGIGSLSIGGGATMTLSSVNSNFSIGVNATGVGSVSVADQFTIVTVENDLVVGQQGIGQLEITDGALVRTNSNSTARAVRIGANASGVGTVIVDGVGSLLRAGSNLVVGGEGQGTLSIRDHAFVDVDNTTAATITVGPFGRIEMHEGTLVGNKPVVGFGTTVDGFFGGSGLVRTSAQFRDRSLLHVGPNEVLRFDGDVSNNGSINVDGGELRFLAGFTNNPETASPDVLAGRITLENGTVHFFEPLTNHGVISAANGVNNIYGRFENDGSVVVAREAVMIFNGIYTTTVNGEIEILPGGNALLMANGIFLAQSLLAISVGPDDTAAQLRARGELALAGDLEVALSPGYTPAVGASIPLLAADGGIRGAFDNVTLPTLSNGLGLDLVYGDNNVFLKVLQTASGLPGDYNSDGTVDAADYVVWRNQLGGGTALANDDTPGVGQDDYTRWRANFGRTVPIAAGSASIINPAIPEPPSVLLAALAFLTFTLPKRVRQSE